MEYVLFGMVVFFFAGAGTILVGVVIAHFIDWHHKQKYGAWEELKRTSYERKRPAAK